MLICIYLLFFVLCVDGLFSGFYLLLCMVSVVMELVEVLVLGDECFINCWLVVDFDVVCLVYFGLIQFVELGFQELQCLVCLLFCYQDIVVISVFLFGMVGEFNNVMVDGYGYWELLCEVGFVGQVFYFEVEVVGVCGIGIGCFFDDLVYEIFGLIGSCYQSVYYFIVGILINDIWIEIGLFYF